MSPVPPCPCTVLGRGEPLEVPRGGQQRGTQGLSHLGGVGRVRTCAFRALVLQTPRGGGGGQWGQTATPADPAVEQVGPWGIGKGLHRLAEAQPSALPAWPRPLDWVTNFTHIWASSSGHRKSVERSRLRPPLAAKAPHLSREWKA